MRAARIDKNQPAILKAIEARAKELGIGCSTHSTAALGGGFTDVIVGLDVMTVRVEWRETPTSFPSRFEEHTLRTSHDSGILANVKRVNGRVDYQVLEGPRMDTSSVAGGKMLVEKWFSISRRINVIGEIKNPEGDCKLTGPEAKFHEGWEGQIGVWETVDDALRDCGLLEDER